MNYERLGPEWHFKWQVKSISNEKQCRAFSQMTQTENEQKDHFCVVSREVLLSSVTMLLHLDDSSVHLVKYHVSV